MVKHKDVLVEHIWINVLTNIIPAFCWQLNGKIKENAAGTAEANDDSHFCPRRSPPDATEQNETSIKKEEKQLWRKN